MKKAKPFEISMQEVAEAFELVKANKGAGGVDKVEIGQYEQELEDNLYKLWNRMSSGSYFPKAVKGVEVPKKNGKVRLLGIPTVEDRVAQMVVRQRFEPKVEPLFLDDSYGYRPNKSAIEAIGAARKRCFEYAWVIEFDIKGLFDNIDHDLLMKAVGRHAEEKWVVLYTQRFLEAPMVMPDKRTEQRTKGTPQGGVISPVLANLFMHYAFDRWMRDNFPHCPWERYADDGLVHCATLKQAEYVLDRLKARMAECKLELHPDKTKIVYCRNDRNKGHHENEKFDFLGYTFKTRWYRGEDGKFREVFTPAVSKEATESLKDKIKAICKGSTAWSLKELAGKLNPIIRGWCNYFMVYRKSEVSKVLYHINYTIALWYRRNHKRVGGSLKKTWRYLTRRAKAEPELFYQWKIGIVPTTG